jgi:energy-coupling factor transporter ATP-binding protein EcfA2
MVHDDVNGGPATRQGAGKSSLLNQIAGLIPPNSPGTCPRSRAAREGEEPAHDTTGSSGVARGGQAGGRSSGGGRAGVSPGAVERVSPEAGVRDSDRWDREGSGPPLGGGAGSLRCARGCARAGACSGWAAGEEAVPAADGGDGARRRAPDGT